MTVTFPSERPHNARVVLGCRPFLVQRRCVRTIPRQKIATTMTWRLSLTPRQMQMWTRMRTRLTFRSVVVCMRVNEWGFGRCRRSKNALASTATLRYRWMKNRFCRGAPFLTPISSLIKMAKCKQTMSKGSGISTGNGTIARKTSKRWRLS